MTAPQQTEPLSHDRIAAIALCARIMSVLSLLGSCFIISTFLCFVSFRKPINRLVFYATWGNILANVATLISTAAIPMDPSQFSSFCEFQGILIQWFMMADCLWVFCMANNVLLVFWYGYDSQQLRCLEKWYTLFAYGVPGIPSLIYVIWDHFNEPRIIGSATLWCWVSQDFEWMRLAFFYGPVWISVIATLTIYIVTGVKVFKKRALLDQFLRKPNPGRLQESSTSHANIIEPPMAATEAVVVTQDVQHGIHEQSLRCQSASDEGDYGSLHSCSSTHNLWRADHAQELQELSYDNSQLSHMSRDQGHRINVHTSSHGHGTEVDDAIHTSVVATQPREPSMLPPQPSSTATHHNDAALAYFNVSFLMFVALFMVWVPSSVNRLYQFINHRPIYALNIISAIVLPLQGSWNATIYLYTTRFECRRAYLIVKSRLTGKPIGHQSSRSLRKESLNASHSTQYSQPEIQLDITRGFSGGVHVQLQ